MGKTSTTQFVRVRREALVSCMTCPLCNKLLEEATTISECLHSCEFSVILMMAWILSSNVMIWVCCVVWYYGLGLSYYSELMLCYQEKHLLFFCCIFVIWVYLIWVAWSLDAVESLKWHVVCYLGFVRFRSFEFWSLFILSFLIGGYMLILPMGI